jgi:hypothetical protein
LDASEPAKAKFTPNPSKPTKAHAKAAAKFFQGKKFCFPWISFAGLSLFKGLRRPWAKNLFHRLLSLNPFALLDRRKPPPCLLRFLRGLLARALMTIGILADHSVLRKEMSRACLALGNPDLGVDRSSGCVYKHHQLDIDVTLSQK